MRLTWQQAHILKEFGDPDFPHELSSECIATTMIASGTDSGTSSDFTHRYEEL